jgi:hypothetical protein
MMCGNGPENASRLVMRDFGGGDHGALNRANKARRRHSPTNTMKLFSAPLEASPKAVSDDAEHQKDGY